MTKQCLNGVVAAAAAVLAEFWERTARREKGLKEDLRERNGAWENRFCLSGRVRVLGRNWEWEWERWGCVVAAIDEQKSELFELRRQDYESDHYKYS